MRIDKQKKDNRYITIEPLEELREVAFAWNDRAGGQRIRNLVAELDELLHEEFIQLPKDSEGVTWTGDEARMICEFVDKSEEEQPTDENPALCDGIVLSGGKWYTYEVSLDGSHISMYPAEKCRHVKSPVKEKLKDFGKKYADAVKYGEDVEELLEEYSKELILFEPEITSI